MDMDSDHLDVVYDGVSVDGLRVVAECARAWRHGNCGDDLLISFVDQFEAKMPSLFAKEASA